MPDIAEFEGYNLKIQYQAYHSLYIVYNITIVLRIKYDRKSATNMGTLCHQPFLL